MFALPCRCLVALAVLLMLGRAPAEAQGKAPVPPSTARLQASALDHFYNLEYSAAMTEFRRLAELHSNSAAAWNHVSQVELYQEMYRIGALQSQLYGHDNTFFDVKLKPVSPEAVTAFLTDNQKAMTLAAAALAREPNDARAHYDLAVAWGLRGTLDFTLRRSYWSALGAAKKARAEAEFARRLDPSFVDPELIVGVQNYVAGSLPWSAKIFSTLVGYRGNKEQGRAQIADVVHRGENARTDATVLLAVVDRRDGRNHKAAVLLRQLTQAYPRNVLFAVETAEAEDAAGEHAAARAAYETVIHRAETRQPGFDPVRDEVPLDRVWYNLGGIDRLYSRWQAAAADFEQVGRLPHPNPQYAAAASLAAQAMRQRAGERH